MPKHPRVSQQLYLLTAAKPAEEMATRDQPYYAAGTIQWVSRLAFEPPLLGVSVGLFSHLNETIDHSGSFTLHLLDQARAHYAELFAGTNQVEEAAINGVPFALKGRALLLENLPYLHCQLKQSHRHGDHTFHVGEITESRALPAAWQPLVTAQDELDYHQTLAKKD